MKLTKNWEIIWPIRKMVDIELDIGEILYQQIKNQIRKEMKDE